MTFFAPGPPYGPPPAEPQESLDARAALLRRARIHEIALALIQSKTETVAIIGSVGIAAVASKIVDECDKV